MTSAIVLAGGLGTRLRSAVPDLPKPMAPVNGRPFLEHLMNYWIAQGIVHFVISVGYRHEQIIQYFGNSYQTAKIEYSIEETPLGTGGGLLLARNKLNTQKPFLLLNGDTYFKVNLRKLVTFASHHDADWSFCLFRSNEKDRYTPLSLALDGKISSFSSCEGVNDRLANGGVYWVTPKGLDLQIASQTHISLENDIFPLALQTGKKLMGIEFDEPFIDIGVPSDYLRAGTLLKDQQKEETYFECHRTTKEKYRKLDNS
jgi:D-glycero-alpha-D-manno-heptose 1-phosphate guanylyltransferase